MQKEVKMIKTAKYSDSLNLNNLNIQFIGESDRNYCINVNGESTSWTPEQVHSMYEFSRQCMSMVNSIEKGQTPRSLKTKPYSLQNNVEENMNNQVSN